MALRVGIVGMGGIGNTHARAYGGLGELAKLVAVCDVVKEKADTAAAKYGVKAYYMLKEMLAHEEMDFVDVTTGGYENGSWHFEPAMEAMAAGKHVLCEKPLSNDIGEAREMVRYATEKKLYLGCNLNHYFTPTAERARKYMDDGLIGELVYCLFKVGFNGGGGDLRVQQVAAVQPALRPHEGVPHPPVQRDAPLLRQHHPRADVLDQARLPQEQGRPAALREQRPRPLRQRHRRVPAQPAG